MELTILSDFEMPGLADGIARQGAGARLLSVAANEPLPARLAMMSPSDGVMPIDVSTLRPWSIAHSEAPTPRWRAARAAPAPCPSRSGSWR